MRQTVFKFLAGLVMAGTLLTPVFATAQSATSTTQINAISSLLQQIKVIQDQINALKTSQITLKTQAATEFGAFLTNISLGSQGDAVIALQSLLAANPNMYPEGQITGYFGKATERALKHLQKENGLDQVGNVGPKTRALLNQLLQKNRVAFEDDEHGSNNDNKKKHICVIISPGQTIASGWLRKHDGKNQILKECKNNGDNNTSDKTAPVISSIVGTPGYNSATVTWMTNKNATTKVYYGTTTPLSFNTSGVLSTGNSNLTQSHNIIVAGLSPLSTYYYVVESKDASGNIATSSVQSFVTTSLPIPVDTTAPVLSGIITTPGATTTTVVWNTNEVATSKIYFGTSTPVVFGSASFVSDSNLVTSHSPLLSSLATSTTYHFVIESKDSHNNSATSSDMMFTTLSQ